MLRLPMLGAVLLPFALFGLALFRTRLLRRVITTLLGMALLLRAIAFVRLPGILSGRTLWRFSLLRLRRAHCILLRCRLRVLVVLRRSCCFLVSTGGLCVLLRVRGLLMLRRPRFLVGWWARRLGLLRWPRVRRRSLTGRVGTRLLFFFWLLRTREGCYSENETKECDADACEQSHGNPPNLYFRRRMVGCDE
jgi:hypothetical protein